MPNPRELAEKLREIDLARNWDNWDEVVEYEGYLTQAADEIERLEEENEKLRKLVEDATTPD